MNTMTKQLSDLKKGDQVFLKDSRPGEFDSIETIERVTRTQIILPHNNRFRIKDGGEIRGDIWWRKTIRPATAELIAEVERQNKIKAVRIKALGLIERLRSQNNNSKNVAAAIPHLEAALAALNDDPDNKKHA